MKVIVYHGGYGCETGCCGHWVEVYDRDDANRDMDDPDRERFEFGHPWDGDETSLRAYAEQIVREKFDAAHVADLDWENSLVVSDCDW